MSSWREVILDALVEINAYNPNDPLEAPDAQQNTRRLNRIIDSWAARKIFAYNVDFTLYTITPNHSPILIGPGLASPDFAATRRPTRIESAQLVLTGQNPDVDLQLNIRDDQWWANQSVKNLTSNIPTDLYYSPAYPNGQIILWPIATQGNGLRLETWVELGQVPLNIGSTFAAAPGYELAIVLTLAEQAAGPYGKPASADLIRRAAAARAALQSNNAASPRIQSADWGAQGRRTTADFNYESGLPSSSL